MRIIIPKKTSNRFFIVFSNIFLTLFNIIRILTMEKSLQILTKKTKSECEEKYRAQVMFMNGLAGFNIIEENVGFIK